MNALTQMFLNVLNWIQQYIGDYGWSIVLFTLLFRLVLFPMDFYQKKTMKKQSDLTPKINALNQKYANDKEKLNQKTAQLYKEAKINPLSGCLPLIIQLPIFFAFFAAIRTISEQQTFELYSQALQLGGANVSPTSWYWVHNLWQPDSLTASVVPAFDTLSRYTEFANVTDYDTVMAPIVQSFEGFKNGWGILPVLAFATSMLQTWLTNRKNPQPVATDESKAMSQKLMKWIFPVMSLVFCWTSSAAFALYWVASNIGSTVSQLLCDLIMGWQDKHKKDQTEITVE